MEIKKMTEEIEEQKEVKKILDAGGFLCSVFAFAEPESKINEWTFGYFNPENKKITSFLVNEKIIIGAADKPLRKRVHKIKIDEVKISGEEALETAKKEEEKYNKSINKIVISLQKKEKIIWNIGFITRTFSIIAVKVDAKTGNIISSEEESLIQKL